MTPDIESTPGVSNGWRSRLLPGLATVLALAIVVFIAGSLSPAGLPKRQSGGNVGSAVSSQFVHRAEEALTSGDTTLAAQFAERAVEAAPDSRAAKRVQSKVEAAKKSAQADTGAGDSTADSSSGSASGQSSSGSTSGDDGGASAQDPFSKSGADLKKLAPGRVAGFEFSGALLGKLELQKTGAPTDPRSPVASAVWTIREMASAGKAQGFVDKTSRQLYQRDNKTVTIDGAKAFFGTDGDRFATCTYVRGRYVFELLATSKGVRPAEIESQVIEAAKAFPDKL